MFTSIHSLKGNTLHYSRVEISVALMSQTAKNHDTLASIIYKYSKIFGEIINLLLNLSFLRSTWNVLQRRMIIILKISQDKTGQECQSFCSVIILITIMYNLHNINKLDSIKTIFPYTSVEGKGDDLASYGFFTAQYFIWKKYFTLVQYLFWSFHACDPISV